MFLSISMSIIHGILLLEKGVWVARMVTGEREGSAYIPLFGAVLPLRYIMVPLSMAAEEEHLVADIRVRGLGVQGADVVGEALPGGFWVRA